MSTYVVKNPRYSQLIPDSCHHSLSLRYFIWNQFGTPVADTYFDESFVYCLSYFFSVNTYILKFNCYVLRICKVKPSCFILRPRPSSHCRYKLCVLKSSLRKKIFRQKVLHVILRIPYMFNLT